MWLLIVYLLIMSLILFLTKKYSKNRFFELLKQYRGWIIILTAGICGSYMVGNYGIEPFTYVFIIFIFVGAIYLAIDRR